MEEFQVREDAPQVLEIPAGNQHQHTPRLPNAAKGVERRAGNLPVFSDRPVVVRGQGMNVHWSDSDTPSIGHGQCVVKIMGQRATGGH